jgi:protease-4
MNAMKLPGSIALSRDARLALITAVLAAAGAIGVDRGWYVAGALLWLAAAAAVAAFYLLIKRPARIPKDAVLTIRIADGLREDAPRSPLEQLRSRGAATLFHIRQALEAVRTDPKVRTVIVEIAAPGIGLATAQELHDLLRALVTAGKRVVAVLSGDQVTIRDYLLASGAGEIVVNPDSAILMLGMAAGGVFLKDALVRLGVEAQTLQWKEYKGAAETFNRTSMSPELRESLAAIIDDWKTTVAGIVAEARKLSVERVHELLGAGFIGTQAALEAGLIDRAGYSEDLRDELDPPSKDEPFVELSRYLRHVGATRNGGRRPHLALIHGLGPIVTGDAPMTGEFISGEHLARDIRDAARDERVRAIVLRVNSPGGSAVGSDLVWRAVREAQKRGKPVVVSMGDVAGSGGYYVAMNADAIVAEPTTITGSIGVVYTKFSAPVLLQKLGVAMESVKTDPISDALSLARAMTEAELAQLNQTVGQLYGNFTAKVAEGRKLTPEAADAVARGRVWRGVAAKARGLVDELGGLTRAVELAREKAGLDADTPHDLVLYPPPGLLGSLNLNWARAEVPAALSVAASILELPPRWAPALIHLVTRGAVILQFCPLWR